MDDWKLTASKEKITHFNLREASYTNFMVLSDHYLRMKVSKWSVTSQTLTQIIIPALLY